MFLFMMIAFSLSARGEEHCLIANCPAATVELTVDAEPSTQPSLDNNAEKATESGSNAWREPVALKTNLLYYAILMPNVEAEWMFAKRWSAALEVQGAWYSKENPHKVYRVATVMPEVRYWPIERSQWHGLSVGVFGGAGLYDLCNGKRGHRGESGLVGVSVGYIWPISKHLSMEGSLGIGYAHLRDKEYQPKDGHYLYQLTRNINYFGPLRAKLSLVWRIPSKKYQTEK